MSCCLGSTPFDFWKHLDIVRHIEFKNAFPQIRSRERKFEQRLARGLFWSRLSNLITIPDWRIMENYGNYICYLENICGAGKPLASKLAD